MNKEPLKFGDKVEFTEVFHGAVYIKEDFSTCRLYYPEARFTVVEPRESTLSIDGGVWFPSAFRKVLFEKKNGSGIIIGQTTRKEGWYQSGGRQRSPEDWEPPCLDIQKSYPFWVVATSLGKTELVPKDRVL